MLNLALRLLNNRKNLLIVVVLDTLGESIKQILLMHGSLIRDGANVCILNLNVETFLLRQIVELVVDVMSVLHIFFEADDGKTFKLLRLMDHRVETVRIVQST